MLFEPVIRLPTAWTSVANRFGVHLFEGQVTVSDMDRMQQVGDEWHRKNPGQLVEMAVVFPSDTRMTGDERSRMVQLIKHWEKHRVASATVILAGGMVGAMHRSVLTGMMMLAPSPHPAKVFATMTDATGWLLPHIQKLCGPGATKSAVDNALSELTVRFKARR